MTILSLLQHLVSHLNPEAGTASSLLVISIFGLGGRGFTGSFSDPEAMTGVFVVDPKGVIEEAILVGSIGKC